MPIRTFTFDNLSKRQLFLFLVEPFLNACVVLCVRLIDSSVKHSEFRACVPEDSSGKKAQVEGQRNCFIFASGRSDIFVLFKEESESLPVSLSCLTLAGVSLSNMATALGGVEATAVVVLCYCCISLIGSQQLAADLIKVESAIGDGCGAAGSGEANRLCVI